MRRAASLWAAGRPVIAAAFDPRRKFRVPLALRLLLRVPGLRTLPARVIGLGFKRVHVK